MIIIYKIVELSNGIRVVYEKIDFVDSVTTGVWIGTGSAMESELNNGVSHYLEHMFFKGTERFGAKEIAERIENLGGQLNALTAKEYTCFYDKVLSEHVEQAVDTLADMLLYSKFSEKDLELERKVILEEINMSEDTPEELIHDLIAESVWQNHPLGRPITGTAESLKKINRQTLLTYYQKQYHPENIIISMVGNFDANQLPDLMEEKFGQWHPKREFINCPSSERVQSGERILIKDTEQCQLCLGMKGLCRNDEDYYALQIINAILGGNMSSRLFQSVREEAGLAYSVYSYHNSYSCDGMFVIYAGLNTENLENALRLINREICTLKKNKLSEQEIAVAKTQLKSSLIMGLESMSARMSHLGKNLLLRGFVPSSAEIMRKIEQVDAQAINRVIERVFNRDSLNLALVGRVEEKNYRDLMNY